MVIAFCGHSEIYDIFELEVRVLGLLRNFADEHSVEMLIGGYGDFDDLAYRCGKRLRDDGGAVSLIYITPYLNMAERRAGYDVTLYPEIEDKPPKFAIVYRNRWMVDKADLVIAYVNYRRGGAYKTYAYAKRKEKTVINLVSCLDAPLGDAWRNFTKHLQNARACDIINKRDPIRKCAVR